ncbi:MAG: hypothetical protein K1X67_08110 [Fimbriimonadaceae bacterium]|nr:hypothetical protein [Fimbriimonadaceae bacterium]
MASCARRRRFDGGWIEFRAGGTPEFVERVKAAMERAVKVERLTDKAAREHPDYVPPRPPRRGGCGGSGG